MQDEELPQPPVRSARSTLLRRAVTVLLAVAIVVAAIARLSTHTTPKAAPPMPSTAAPSVSPSAAGSSDPSTRAPTIDDPFAALVPLHRLSSAAIDAAHAECPRLAPTCTTTGETPAGVRAALTAAFPEATGLVAVSDIAYRFGGGPRLVFRQLSARAGMVRIAVEVRQGSADDRDVSIAVNDGPRQVVRSETVLGSLTVEVQISSPAGQHLDVARVRRLGADRRLLAIG